jgi:hypothetical protein
MMEYPVVDMSSAYRYVVLDAQGFLLNRILVNSPYPEGYWPGYGRYIAYAGEDPAPPVPENPDVAPDFTYLSVRPSMPMQWGAQMNIQTGEVTPPPPPPPEPPVEEPAP